MRLVSTAALAACLLLSAPARAEGTDDTAGDPFALGQIVVTAPAPQGIAPGGETLTAPAMQAFQRQTLDDAVNLMPGVAAANSGGTRNERLIYVRGFDRFQVPLSIDGIRVYLPADNRLDFGRFLAADIAEVQVAKGYASVLDGPGAMGGAINLVTSKPVRALEGEVRAALNLGREGEYSGYTAYGRIGTAHDHWYAQASFARSLQDHWDLPGSYVPTIGSVEDGGHRDFSNTADWRLNVKAGYTPNTTDEYSLNYTRQEGSKNAPLHITDAASAQRNWSWPYWNIDSLYFLSTTALGDRATLKTRIYTNTFDNLLRSFDNAAQTTQTLARAFNSYYADKAWGGSAELGLRVSEADQLTLALHYRRDKHVEWQQSFPSGSAEPPQTDLEDTWSLAAENRLALSPAVTLAMGASYDWRDLKTAEEYGTPPGGTGSALFSYPLADADALNGQAQLVWAPGDATRINASVSSRARFPTIFERFSTQFGTAASNPGLKAERATNVELGGSRRFGAVKAEGALFYSHVADAIVSVVPAGFPAGSSQRQNLGDGDYYGAELSLTATVSPALELGANYTWTHRDFTITGAAAGTTVPAFALTGVPEHKAFVYASWQPFGRLRVLPSLDLASDRMTVTTGAASTLSPTAPPVRYYETGGYAIANLSLTYAVTPQVELGIAARNLFDEYYVLTDGFPEPGRSFSLTASARF
ncbi:TonB-dependent receptor [Novosphingobium flavum]|uniref:TonB-dependent receptor n=1 Tax=Novosphingobium flavum TaxID=1778672 RepID=A0A7X1KN45_9SPHN|nr:TonB-dependent receptor [Novosphingobium flavum]MBC2667304.1 TonB-dependent receptor [Novosphingobium flavum]